MKGNQECPVLKHNLEPTENLGPGGRRRGSRKDKETVRDDQGQNQNMGLDGEGKSKSVCDSKQRKLSPLRLSISNNQARRRFYHTQSTHSYPLTRYMYIVAYMFPFSMHAVSFSLREIFCACVSHCHFLSSLFLPSSLHEITFVPLNY